MTRFPSPTRHLPPPLRRLLEPLLSQEPAAQLIQRAFDDAEIQARLPKPPGRPRKSLKLQPG